MGDSLNGGDILPGVRFFNGTDEYVVEGVIDGDTAPIRARLLTQDGRPAGGLALFTVDYFKSVCRVVGAAEVRNGRN